MPEKYRVTTEDGTYMVTVGDDEPSAPPQRDLMGKVLSEGGGAVMKFAERAVDLPGSIYGLLAPPNPGIETDVATYGTPVALAAKRMLIDPQAAMFEKAAASSMQGETPESVGYRVAGALPVLGPMAVGYADTARKEGLGAALGSAGFDAALAGLGGKGAGKVDKYITERPARLDAKAYSNITKVLRPSDKDFRFERNMDMAVPEIAEQARILGKDPKNPVAGVQEFLDLTKAAKERLRDVYEQFVGPLRPAIMLDGDKIAQAIDRTINAKMRRESPQEVARLESLADRYRGQIGLEEGESLLENVNNELHAFYRKDRMGQAQDIERQSAARNQALARTLHGEMYSKIDAMAGKGIADVQRRYGALKDMEAYSEPLALHIKRFGNKDIGEMALEGAADVGAGAIYSKSGALIRGARAVKRMVSGGPNEMIAAAFKRLGHLESTTPAPVAKNIKGLLQKGAIRTGGPPDPSGVKGFQAPFGDMASQMTQGSQRLLPAIGETAGIENYLAQSGTQLRHGPGPQRLIGPPAIEEAGLAKSTVTPASGAEFAGLDRNALARLKAMSGVSDLALITLREMAANNYPETLPVVEFEMMRRGLLHASQLSGPPHP